MRLRHSAERAGAPTTEEAASQHVGVLVARGVPRPEIFEAVVERVACTFGVPGVGVMCYDSAAT